MPNYFETRIPGRSYPDNIKLLYGLQDIPGRRLLLDSPLCSQISSVESVSSSTSQGFNGWLFDASQDAKYVVSNSKPVRIPSMYLGGIYKNTKSFNRLIKDIWVRPQNDLTVCIIDINKKYSLNSTDITYLTSGAGTVKFLEFGRYPLSQESHYFGCYRQDINNQTEVIFNESFYDSKIFSPVNTYNSMMIDTSIRTQTWNYESDAVMSSPEPWANTKSISKLIPSSLDFSKVFVNLSKCYNYWDGNNDMLGVAVCFKQYNNDSYYGTGNYIHFKVWTTRVNDLYGMHAGQYYPYPSFASNYNPNELIPNTQAYRGYVQTLPRNFYIDPKICYFPTHY